MSEVQIVPEHFAPIRYRSLATFLGELKSLDQRQASERASDITIYWPIVVKSGRIGLQICPFIPVRKTYWRCKTDLCHLYISELFYATY